MSGSSNHALRTVAYSWRAPPSTRTLKPVRATEGCVSAGGVCSTPACRAHSLSHSSNAPSIANRARGARSGRSRGVRSSAIATSGTTYSFHRDHRASWKARRLPRPFVNPFPFVRPFVIPRRAAAIVDVRPFTRPWGAAGTAIFRFLARPFGSPFVSPCPEGRGRASRGLQDEPTVDRCEDHPGPRQRRPPDRDDGEAHAGGLQRPEIEDEVERLHGGGGDPARAGDEEQGKGSGAFRDLEELRRDVLERHGADALRERAGEVHEDADPLRSVPRDEGGG